MTEVLFLEALKKRLEVVLKDIYHPTDPSRGRDQEYKSPQIVKGYLPPKRSGDKDQDFPLVIIRASEWRTEEMGDFVYDLLDVKILIGSYGEDENDYEYALNIFRRILNDLRVRPCLNDKYRMRKSIKAVMPDEQARDVYYLVATTTWEIPTPQEYEKDDGYEPEK